MPRSIDVFLVAPALLCWGFEKLARNASLDMRMCGSATRLAEAAEALQRVSADVLVVDVDEVAHMEALRSVCQQHPVVLLVPSEEAGAAARWQQAGVHALVARRESPAVLLDAIRGAASSCSGARPVHLIRVMPPAERQPEAARLASLTSRERQLLYAVICNTECSGKVLAGQLCISEHTLRNHLTSIYGKLGVQNRLSLHAFALRNNLDNDAGFLGR